MSTQKKNSKQTKTQQLGDVNKKSEFETQKKTWRCQHKTNSDLEKKKAKTNVAISTQNSEFERKTQ